MERAGTLEKSGSITGIYTVLVEGDDMNEPIADAVRSIADGHIVLSRALAHKGHYPSVDVLSSISRVMDDIADDGHRDAAQELVRVLATYRDAEDFINIGAYTDGSDPDIDYAKSKIQGINDFLQQPIHECVPLAASLDQLKGLAA
jgi:flagellum-specific ATP synthase